MLRISNLFSFASPMKNVIDTSMKYNNIAYERLLAYNIKPSVQRIAIMEYLMKHRTHPSVDDIYTDLVSTIPTLSRTTVYNTLHLFAEHGAALMLTIDDHNTHFDGFNEPHAHLLCRRCGAIHDLPMPKGMKSHVKQLEGHAIEEVHAYYKGVCKECLTAEKQSMA